MILIGILASSRRVDNMKGSDGRVGRSSELMKVARMRYWMEILTTLLQ